MADSLFADSSLEIPKDTDGDLLPDAFEKKAKYYTAERRLLPFDSTKKKSDELQAEDDGKDDSDLDNRPRGPKHNEFGDGLTAWEEYRGFRVKGPEGEHMVGRTIDLFDDGPDRSAEPTGGTHIKDIFVYSENGKRARLLFQRFSNRFFTDFKLIWHLIDREDMTKDHNKAGFIDKNGDKNQRALWLHDIPVGAREMEDRPYTLGFSDFSVNSGNKVNICSERVLNRSEGYGVDYDLMLNHVVAHEIGHILTLHHNEGKRVFGTLVKDKGEPPAANVDKYYVKDADKKKLHFWMPVVNKVYPLEYVDGVDIAGVHLNGVVEVTPYEGKVTVHEQEHDAGKCVQEISHSVQFGFNHLGVEYPKPTLILQAHMKNLLDPVLQASESGDVQNDPLTEEQEKKPNVRS